MGTAPTTTAKTIKGGSFLVEDRAPEEIFIPEEFTDEQRQIGQTVEEFVTKEVLPHAEELEQHKEGLMGCRYSIYKNIVLNLPTVEQ